MFSAMEAFSRPNRLWPPKADTPMEEGTVQLRGECATGTCVRCSSLILQLHKCISGWCWGAWCSKDMWYSKDAAALCLPCCSWMVAAHLCLGPVVVVQVGSVPPLNSCTCIACLSLAWTFGHPSLHLALAPAKLATCGCNNAAGNHIGCGLAPQLKAVCRPVCMGVVLYHPFWKSQSGSAHPTKLAPITIGSMFSQLRSKALPLRCRMHARWCQITGQVPADQRQFARSVGS